MKSLPLPNQFFIYIKNSCLNTKLRVKINEKVLRGQPLIFGDDVNVPVHAPTSGWIKDISFYANSVNQSKHDIKITILSDYSDKWIRLQPIQDYKKYTSEKLITKIYQSGIVGLGGGQFSSAKKLTLSIKKNVKTLIVNAVESEPYITSDNCLINNHMYEILRGCKIVAWISKITRVLIAIQEDRVEAISQIYSFIKYESLFEICLLKKKYPGGSSKVLIKALTGKEIPCFKHSIDIGYLIFNIATIYSIKRAIINGEPLTERIVTILSDKNFFSDNFWIRIGTPIKYFLNNKKFNKNYTVSVYLGGPFMGEKTYNPHYSVLKKTNCIFIQYKKEHKKKNLESPCIRCSYCSNVCPVNLLPQQLYWYSKNHNHEKTKTHHVLDCIECKACEKVCPSYIPLVKYFKEEKKILNNIHLENIRKKISFTRFKLREQRLSNIKRTMNNKNILCIKNKNIDVVQEKNMRKKILEAAIERMNSKKQHFL